MTLKFIVLMSIKGLVTTGGAYLGISGFLNNAPAPAATVETGTQPSALSAHKHQSVSIPKPVQHSGS
jgi:hypothetical protein